MTFAMGGGPHAGSQQYIMRNAGLEEAQAGIKIAGRKIKNLRYADDTTLIVGGQSEVLRPWQRS